MLTYGGSDPNGQHATIFISTSINASQKGKVSKMIENKNGVSKDLEKALQALEQAKQRVANEKKKQNEKKRKAEKPLPRNPLSPMPNW